MVAMLVTVALILGGCVTPETRWVSPTSGQAGAPSASGQDDVAAARWRPCPDLARDLLQRVPSNVEFSCATVKVPQDWSTAKGAVPSDGRTFDIALVRVRSTTQRAADRIGSVVVNPGGPGASGVETAVLLSSAMPTEVLRRFDLIGFDPRGVGTSAAVRCTTDADLDAYFGAEPDPLSQADFDAVAGLQRRIAEACGTKYGESLRLFSTEQTARDMDAIRAAVGDAKLTYLGFSYGTLLGAVYAQLFPQRVRALVLDGAVDPTQTLTQSSEGQAKGFERAFDNFATWCRNTPSGCQIGPDARASVMNALATARTNPASTTAGRKATAGWVFLAVIQSLYLESTWRQLASALDSLRRGNPAQIFGLADDYGRRGSDGRYENLFDANVVVNCTDDDHAPTVEQIRAMQGRWRTKYPLFGGNLALNLVCAQWPGKHDPFPKGPATGAPPILVVGTTGDPATPYEQTAALATMLGVGVVLTCQGSGHTAYLETRCVNDAVDQYLIELKVPEQGKTCPPR
jgi:pimeloyl-ACP methyl ester carboxylesterase